MPGNEELFSTWFPLLTEAEDRFAPQAGPWEGVALRRTPLALVASDGFLLCNHPLPPERARLVLSGTAARPCQWVGEVLPFGDEALVTYRGHLTVFVRVPDELTDREREQAVIGLWRGAAERWLELHVGGGVPLLATPYPALDAGRNALGRLEGQLLAEALAAPEARLAELARAVALVRRERRGQLDDEQIAYEQSLELIQGVALYAGYLAAERAPDQAGAAWTGKLVAPLLRINQQGWGAGRRRFFYSGLGLCLLLRRLHGSWEHRLRRGVTLDQLLEAQVEFDGQDGDEALLAEVELRLGYARFLEEERRFSSSMRARGREVLEQLLNGPGQLLVFDISNLAETDRRFDHEASAAVNDHLVLHQGPVELTFGHTRLRFAGVPVAEDRLHHLVQVRVDRNGLKASGDGRALKLTNPAEFEQGLELRLPGLEVTAEQGAIFPIDRGFYIKIAR